MPEYIPPSSPQTSPDPAVQKDGEKYVDDETLAAQAMAKMAVRDGGETYYEAADPRYKSAFTRDYLIAMSLRGDLDLLESQTEYSLRRLGTKQDVLSGEEPGKAHHELPSIDLREGLNSAYNACDTTAQLLLALAALSEHNHPQLLETYSSSIKAAIQYISAHINDQGLFAEDPRFSGDMHEDGRERKYALKVTYWKDSELNRPGRREPNYPIVYTLAHFQNAAALSRIGKVLNDEELARQGNYMRAAGLQHLWKDDHFVTAIDGDGVVDGLSSDSLMSLLYVNPADLPKDYAKLVERYMQPLATAAGYRAGMPAVPEVDPYHMKIWTHEQALLNAAARRHNLPAAEDITRRIEPFIIPSHGIFPELVNPETYDPDGNLKQLWAIGAFFYFKDPDRALL